MTLNSVIKTCTFIVCIFFGIACQEQADHESLRTASSSDCSQSLRIYAWNDEDGNGGIDSGEQPLKGVAFSLAGGENGSGTSGDDGYATIETDGTLCSSKTSFSVIAHNVVGAVRTTPAIVHMTADSDLSFGYRMLRSERDCDWEAIVEAWLDSNANGVWDDDELNIADFTFYVDDVKNGFQDIGYQPDVQDESAFVSVWLPGCPDAAFEIYVDNIEGHQLTTPQRLQQIQSNGNKVQLFQFGFAPKK